MTKRRGVFDAEIKLLLRKQKKRNKQLRKKAIRK
jgi:hypothetical protein